jgi:hypothetical protein
MDETKTAAASESAFSTPAEVLAALKLALPYVEHQASFAPTTNSRMGKVLQARKDCEIIRAAIAKATGAQS